MEINGSIRKLKAEYKKPVGYVLPIGNSSVDMNALIGKQIVFHYQNEIRCISCGRKTRKSFSQGYCYPCFISVPETSPCIIKPELCQAHEGIGRDMDWEREHHLHEQYVYLALTGGLKVGVTRSTQIPARWIDQGARKAICLAKTPNRYLAGCIEVGLKKYISDKTNWRRMLRNVAPDADMVREKEKAASLMPEKLAVYLSNDDTVTEIVFPVNEYPEKIKSVTFDKTAVISGVLNGIKGQYLIFNDGRVLNIRRHSGYVVKVNLLM